MVARAGPLVLAIETSCDETAVAVLRGRSGLLAAEVASQVAAHRPYGGIVPEVAARGHLPELPRLLDRVWARAGVAPPAVDAFAATTGPGLATSLLVGVAVAKGLAVGLGKPFFGVNHLEGHLLSPFFGTDEGPLPSVGLVVSGGHTLLVELRAPGDYRLLGRTRDDAAGEAFDKVGKMLGLPYPAGPEIERMARAGDPGRFALPRGLLGTPGCDFSFSGLKTAMRRLLPELRPGDIADACASFQEAVVEVLVMKTVRAALATGRSAVGASGGVSRNARLREALVAGCREAGLRLFLAEPALCTDNAVMIARVAVEKAAAGTGSDLAGDIDPNLGLDLFRIP